MVMEERYEEIKAVDGFWKKITHHEYLTLNRMLFVLYCDLVVFVRRFVVYHN